MNKSILLLIMLLVIPFVLSATSSNVLDVLPQNQTMTIDISANASCTSKFYSNNGTTIFRNESLSFTIPASVHANKGIYKTKVNCSDGTIYTKSYFVTQTGQPPANTGLMIFIYLFAIIAFIAIIATFVNNMFVLIMMKTDIFDVLYSFGAYILFFIMLYFAQTYLIDTFLENLMKIIQSFTLYSNVILVSIGFIIHMILIPLLKLDKHFERLFKRGNK